MNDCLIVGFNAKRFHKICILLSIYVLSTKKRMVIHLLDILYSILGEELLKLVLLVLEKNKEMNF